MSSHLRLADASPRAGVLYPASARCGDGPEARVAANHLNSHARLLRLREWERRDPTRFRGMGSRGPQRGARSALSLSGRSSRGARAIGPPRDRRDQTADVARAKPQAAVGAPARGRSNRGVGRRGPPAPRPRPRREDAGPRGSSPCPGPSSPDRREGSSPTRGALRDSPRRRARCAPSYRLSEARISVSRPVHGWAEGRATRRDSTVGNGNRAADMTQSNAWDESDPLGE